MSYTIVTDLARKSFSSLLRIYTQMLSPGGIAIRLHDSGGYSFGCISRPLRAKV